MESMLATAKSWPTRLTPCGSCYQSGDGVLNGRAGSWNVAIRRSSIQLSSAGIPYFLSVGNHDVAGAEDLDDPGRIEGLCHYLPRQLTADSPEGSPHRLVGYPTYAFGFGNSYFIAFDSNIPEDTIQAAWVEPSSRRSIAANVNVVVFFHLRLFHRDRMADRWSSVRRLAIRKRYMPMFRKYHVKLLLTGHEHSSSTGSSDTRTRPACIASTRS